MCCEFWKDTAAMMSESAVITGGRHGVVVVLERQSLKRHVLQIRRHQNLRELRNNHRIGVRILAGIGQVGERPRRSRAVQKPLPRLRELVLNILDQIAMVGNETVRGGMVRFGGGSRSDKQCGSWCRHN